MTERKKAANVQTEGEDVAMINAADENCSIHRRFVLKIALKIDDREEDENFTAADEADEADEANEKEVDEAAAINEAAEKEKEILINEKNVAIAKSEYLTKVFSTALVIIAFNS